jgi:hypothetical protein
MLTEKTVCNFCHKDLERRYRIFVRSHGPLCRECAANLFPEVVKLYPTLYKSKKYDFARKVSA